MCQVDVRCITDDPHENWAEGVDFGWDDESVDELVDNMVRLIGEDFAFKKEMFIGGLTCITDDPHENWAEGVDFGWDDESVDELVDNMVRLIGEDFAFKKEMFIGGLTLAELGRSRALKNLRIKKLREARERHHSESTEADTTRKSSK
ncbi:hypothetical protein Bca52824_065335 [Brassica carinata]|uniref:Uncharacterized protein n=1 Tax=Brassica carinata TaxID=52824 RepID=A0A8X7U935_BRACI|nr:hypothetical protein Bca52824_065335 [Brassica carinata]